jgi:hypothetical protein
LFGSFGTGSKSQRVGKYLQNATEVLSFKQPKKFKQFAGVDFPTKLLVADPGFVRLLCYGEFCKKNGIVASSLSFANTLMLAITADPKKGPKVEGCKA